MHRWFGLLVIGGVMGCGDPGDHLGDDSCTDGDVMSNPRVADGFLATASMPDLHLTWSTGPGNASELPLAYFDQVKVALETDAAVRDLISSIEHPPDRELIVHFASLTNFLASSNELAFTLEFPDKREFIGCTHPGMTDRYLLDVALTLDDSGTIVSQNLSQRVDLGAI